MAAERDYLRAELAAARKAHVRTRLPGDDDGAPRRRVRVFRQAQAKAGWERELSQLSAQLSAARAQVAELRELLGRNRARGATQDVRAAQDRFIAELLATAPSVEAR